MATQSLTVEHLPEPRTGASVLVQQEAAPARTAAKGSDRRAQALVVAFPFSSFGRTNAFITAVRALPGVVAATPRRLHGGALYLGVDYDRDTPLDSQLAGLSEFRPRVTVDGDGMISVVIEAV